MANAPKLLGIVNVSSPNGIASDGRGQIFIDNASYANTVEVVSDSTYQVEESLHVGSGPASVAYDPVDGDIFVLNAGSSNLSVISASSLRTVRNVSVPGMGSGSYESIAVDNTSGVVFVDDYSSSNVSMISPSSYSVLSTDYFGGSVYPTALAYDYARNETFVASAPSTNLTILSGPRYDQQTQVPIGAQPISLAYDPQLSAMIVGTLRGEVCVVSDVSNAVVSRFNVSNFTDALIYDPGTRELVATAAASESTPGEVVFLSPANGTVLATVSVSTYPDQLAYDNASDSIWVGSIYASQVEAVSDGSPEYAVTFESVDLPIGIPWSVTLGRVVQTARGSQTIFAVVNGTYDFTLAPIEYWKAAPFNGTIIVEGSSVSRTIDWTRTAWAVMFFSSGLPTGQAWYVLLNGSLNRSTGNSMNFEEGNGSYSYMVTPATPGWNSNRSQGILLVAGGPVNISLGWSRATYLVTFEEVGLPAEANWSVLVGGVSLSSDNSTIDVYEPNGTTTYEIAARPGWIPADYSGSVLVQGRPVAVTIPWSAATVVLTIQADGLPSGTGWSASLGGKTVATSSSSLQFTLANGTYDLIVHAPSGYTASPTNATIMVVGQPKALTVDFTVAPTPLPQQSRPSTFLGLPLLTGAVSLGAILALVVAGFAVAFYRVRRPWPPGSREATSDGVEGSSAPPNQSAPSAVQPASGVPEYPPR